MKREKLPALCILILGSLCLSSCATSTKLNVSDVCYQSIRNVHTERSPKSDIPRDASILVEPVISSTGDVDVYVTNLTDSIMVIDRTKSFFVDPRGISTIYYDPTVKTTTNSVTTGTETGSSVNLGAIGGALGVGGRVGRILDGINVDNSKLNANTTTTSTYQIDTPTGSIAPRGKASMARTFYINDTAGKSFLGTLSSGNTRKSDIRQEYNKENTYGTFRICISYSFDGGKTFDKIVSDFYCNSVISSPVRTKGRVNESLRNVLMSKKEIFKEPWFLLYFRCNISTGTNAYINNELYDYK